MNKLLIFSAVAWLGVLGCNKADKKDALEEVTVVNFDNIESEVMEIEKTVRERDSKERLYTHFYAEREEILKIARGNFEQGNPLHRALIREMSWTVLGELKERRPDFDLRYKREHQKPKPKPELEPEPLVEIE